MNEYEKQAEDFLRRNKLRMTITKVRYTPPLWEDENNMGRRNKYSVAIHRKPTLAVKYDMASMRRIWFDFWGSVSDAERGFHPSPYDVLACISSDVFCPDTFEEFCREYGYDKNRRKARMIFWRANSFAKRLRSFFSEEELEELREIQ